ncbi:MAG: hypothetical protein DSZ30_04185 [Aquificaceae bacterium]|nr:MAG: hypothetical protein DSZ30_04185 [Aquificaceae bacterium]
MKLAKDFALLFGKFNEICNLIFGSFLKLFLQKCGLISGNLQNILEFLETILVFVENTNEKGVNKNFLTKIVTNFAVKQPLEDFFTAKYF